jgi:hypothetical protein
MNRKVFRGPLHYGIAFDEHGKSRTVASVGQWHPDDQTGSGDSSAGDVARVVDGSADGGKGRDEGPPPTKMNQLIRELAYGAAMRSARQGG